MGSRGNHYISQLFLSSKLFCLYKIGNIHHDSENAFLFNKYYFFLLDIIDLNDLFFSLLIGRNVRIHRNSNFVLHVL